MEDTEAAQVGWRRLRWDGGHRGCLSQMAEVSRWGRSGRRPRQLRIASVAVFEFSFRVCSASRIFALFSCPAHSMQRAHPAPSVYLLALPRLAAW